MQNYDYVILFDENGQPYIEHSLWSNAKSWGKKASGRVKGGGKTAHKYLMKVGEGVKARYAYTKAEVDALMGRGKKAVSNAASNARNKVREASGANARDRMRAAENAKRRAHVVNTKDYNDYRKTRRAAMGAEYNAIKADAAKTMAGYGVDKAKAEAARARAEVNYDRSELNKAENRYQQQHDKYYGDENSVAKTMERAVSKTAREKHAADKERLDEFNTARTDAYKTLKGGERVLQEAYDAQRRAASEKRMADKEADKADRDSRAADKKVGSANLKVLESDVNYMQSEIDYDRAKREYANTPLGKLDSLVKNVKDASKTVKDYASEKLDDVKDFASDKIDAVKKAYEDRQTKITKIEPANATLKENSDKNVKSSKATNKVSNNTQRKEKPTIGTGDKERDAAFYDSPIVSLDVDYYDGEKHKRKVSRIIQKEGSTEFAKNEASRSLRKADNTDDARRAASEKRMAENELSGLRGTFDAWRRSSERKEIARDVANEDAASSNSPKIDPKKVSTEYVYALGSNTGHASDVNKVMRAETAYNIAMREYNQVAASKNASGQDKNAARQEMNKLKKEYEKLYNDLIDELNEE